MPIQRATVVSRTGRGPSVDSGENAMQLERRIASRPRAADMVFQVGSGDADGHRDFFFRSQG